MFGFSEYSEEGRPWFVIGRVAVTSTVLLVAIFTLSMVVVSILKAADAGAFVMGLPLLSRSVWEGEVWRLFTWPLFNIPSLWFAFSMVMMYFFGREVERVLGRVGLLKLTGWVGASLVVVTLVLPGGSLAGSGLLGFGIFLAFAIMQPGAVMLFGLTAKWVAIILLGISAMAAMAARDGVALVQLATLCVACAVVLKMMGAAYGLPWLRIPVVRIKRAGGGSVQRLEKPVASGGLGRSRALPSTEPEIDRLLDKVAAHGIHSLSDDERRRLAEASERYQRRQ